jgi:putative DNA primase/helicase
VPFPYDRAPTSVAAADDISPPERLRLQQLRPIKCLVDLQAAARDAARIDEMPRGDASEDLWEMAERNGLVDTYGDNTVTAYIAAGFDEGDKDAGQSSTAPNDNSNDELDERALAQTSTFPPGAEIKRLAQLSTIEYERDRKRAAQRLGIRPTILDKLIAAERQVGSPPEGQGRPIQFGAPEPWSNPVDGAALLSELSTAVRRYVVMSPEACDAVALWAAHTWLINSSMTSPKLGITSPEMQCGKTTLLDVLACVVRRPLPSANVTPAAIFRVIEKHCPTLLIDEADTFLRDDKAELRGILNSSHRRWSAHVTRTVGDDHEPRQFSTWAPVAIAMIGRLPATLEDRSIPVVLRRRTSGEKIEAFNPLRAEDLAGLRRQLSRWSTDHADAIAEATPVMPDGLFNRPAENWAPLLAIADCAGGDWPARARSIIAAIGKAGGSAERSIRTILLTDVRAVFDARGDRLPTRMLIEGLLAIEERPWSEWKGRPLSPAGLAKLLAPFGIIPENIRTPSGTVLKGYQRERFADAFERYLPDCL